MYKFSIRETPKAIVTSSGSDMTMDFYDNYLSNGLLVISRKQSVQPFLRHVRGHYHHSPASGQREYLLENVFQINRLFCRRDVFTANVFIWEREAEEAIVKVISVTRLPTEPRQFDGFCWWAGGGA